MLPPGGTARRAQGALMRMAFNAVRSAIFVLFMAVTVVPWALAVVLVSIFARGNVVYRMCVGWLDTQSASVSRFPGGARWRH